MEKFFHSAFLLVYIFLIVTFHDLCRYRQNMVPIYNTEFG